MPYAEPSAPSPLPSPAKEHASYRKAHHMPPTHIEDIYASSSSTGPMPGIPRRASSHHSSSSTTPRKAMSPNMSRHSSATHVSPVTRPMEGLPRRSPSAGHTSLGVYGLPPAESSSLGLKLHGSPAKGPLIHRVVKDSMSSTSTVEGSLPSTPSDDHSPQLHGSTPPSVPFPSFDPDYKPPKRASPPRNMLTPSRPSLLNSRRGSAGHVRGGQTGSLQIPIPTSASTSHLPPASSAPSPSLLRPTSSMIRKKSGEVVKPSLKQRSMSTPDLTRQAASESGEEEPSSPRAFGEERSKSVRFADTSEGDANALENVVLFLREQKVTAIGKAVDPDKAHMTETETEADDTDAASDFVQFRTRRNAAAKAVDESGQVQLEEGSRVPRLRTDFSPDARGSLDGENVILERVDLQTATSLSLRGSVIVRNVSFQKWVSIRFTLDHWQTVSEVAGTHVCHIPAGTTGDEGWDRFSFTIKLEDFKRKIDERQLLMCIRFSVDGREWWDSNNGMNYSFTFKRSSPRRPSRSSGPASLGSAYGKMVRSEDDSALPLPGLKRNSTTSATQINKAFGGAESSRRSSGPNNWMFPRLANRMADPPSRPDSPAQSSPPIAFKAPAPPNVHTHLSLSKYCAPSPPQSPPKEQQSPFAPPPLVLLPTTEGESPEHERVMNVMGGQYATLPPPVDQNHERRSSWNGNQSESWDSFATAMEKSGSAGLESMTEGDVTPVAHGSRSPEVGSDTQEMSSPEHKPLTLKRSTGDLRKLMQDAEDNDNGLMTPPSSNISSPPTPVHAGLPRVPSSPTISASTGESSPVDTISTDSTPDLSNLDIDIDPEVRGRTGNSNQKMLSNSYQEFLDKFCFFQSPRMTPNEIEPSYTRPNYIPISGQTSPNGFPFFSTHGSSSPRNTPTPTPTRQYDSSQDAFGFSGLTPAHATPKAIPQRGNVSGQRSPNYAGSPGESRVWAQQNHPNTASPSLAAAK